ncbi:flagellar hook protein FlgE [Azohydromonas australica]|uniref:flagellar hook protein FlgE n=1 Tax=Azohydromonas australica TaxID=364039 RepID=UPI00040666E5|nr:flagellar hook protein FlgE [Azohydromonas australica]
MSSFPQGLSGLNASSKNLEVIGNNIANANTFGAKTSRAEFSHVYTAALGQGGTVQAGAGVRVDTVSQQFTQGNITDTGRSTDLAISGEGFFQVSDGINPTMYTRNGQFKVNNSGEIVNNDGLRLMGYGVNANGQIMSGTLQGLRVPTATVAPRATSEIKLEMNLDSRSTLKNAALATTQSAANAAQTAKVNADEAVDATVTADVADADAVVPALVADKRATAAALLGLDPSDLGYAAAKQADDDASAALVTAGFPNAPAAVTKVVTAEAANTAATNAATALATAKQAAINAFDPADTSTYNYATSQTAYDALGQEVTLNYYFQKGTTDPATNQTSWSVFVSANGQPLVDADKKNVRMELTFEADGSKPVTGSPSAFQLAVPGTDNGAGLKTLPLTVQFDLSKATQRSLTTAVSKPYQDGYAPGNVTSINVQEDGTVLALYSNGKSFTAGQVELAKFVNPQGLQPLSGNLWAGTPASGEPVRGTPGSGVVGKIQSEALEESNVDIASELVNMITAQRSYQANAQTIKTQDQVMQTLINLR